MHLAAQMDLLWKEIFSVCQYPWWEFSMWNIIDFLFFVFVFFSLKKANWKTIYHFVYFIINNNKLLSMSLLLKSLQSWRTFLTDFLFFFCIFIIFSFMPLKLSLTGISFDDMEKSKYLMWKNSWNSSMLIFVMLF